MSAPEISRATEIGIAIIIADDEGLYTVTCKCEYSTRPLENGMQAVEVADHFDFLVKNFGMFHSHPKARR
jgi:hypothetical protein